MPRSAKNIPGPGSPTNAAASEQNVFPIVHISPAGKLLDSEKGNVCGSDRRTAWDSEDARNGSNSRVMSVIGISTIEMMAYQVVSRITSGLPTRQLPGRF